MNPVLILTHNNLELTKRCVESVLKQDIPTEVLIYDNGSTDGTVEWLPEEWVRSDKRVTYSLLGSNRGVSAAWNMGLGYLIAAYGHALVIGNDTVLGPWTYRKMLSIGVPFVTGVAVDKMEQVIEPGPLGVLTSNPDFSCFLATKECWETVGPFDERMKFYAQDCDFHVRAHRLGMRLWKCCLPYYHERSSTLRLASPEERAEINAQANKDRAVFQSLYGCLPGSKEYEEIFK